ncbi:MAG: hypothetical protein ACOZNI_12235 [Myxococcota bacterium]
MTLLWVAVACTGGQKDDTGADDTGDPGSWTTVAADLPGALLSVWGTSASDVWTVGVDGGDGVTIRHWDGASWATSSHAGTLWWTFGIDDVVWAVGEAGAAVRIDTATGAIEEMTLDPAITYFGIWGASADDLWAVGGDPAVISDAGTIWHWDGTAWSEAEAPAEAAAQIAVYKVWGTGASDVWAVGTGGVIVHWDGAAWSNVTSPTPRNLFTVHGAGSEAWAVGGEFSGTVVHWDGAAWTDETPTDPMPQLNGVNAAGEVPVAVGTQGAVWRREGGAWAADPRGAATSEDLHATWVDPDGGIWAVGGHLASYPQINGTLIYGGEAPPAGF